MNDKALSRPFVQKRQKQNTGKNLVYQQMYVHYLGLVSHRCFSSLGANIKK